MYCFLDLETTGIDQFSDQPIELGALLVSKDLIVKKSFHSYMRLDESISFSTSSRLAHGLKETFLKDQPMQYEVLEQFFNTFGHEFRFVSWNISFDIGFFKKLCYENDFLDQFNQINYRHLDLQSIFFFYCQQKRLKSLSSLDDACKHFGIKRSRYHNALEDANIAYKVFKNITDEIGNN